MIGLEKIVTSHKDLKRVLSSGRWAKLTIRGLVLEDITFVLGQRQKIVFHLCELLSVRIRSTGPGNDVAFLSCRIIDTFVDADKIDLDGVNGHRLHINGGAKDPYREDGEGYSGEMIFVLESVISNLDVHNFVRLSITEAYISTLGIWNVPKLFIRDASLSDITSFSGPTPSVHAESVAVGRTKSVPLIDGGTDSVGRRINVANTWTVNPEGRTVTTMVTVGGQPVSAHDALMLWDYDTDVVSLIRRAITMFQTEYPLYLKPTLVRDQREEENK